MVTIELKLEKPVGANQWERGGENTLVEDTVYAKHFGWVNWNMGWERNGEQAREVVPCDMTWGGTIRGFTGLVKDIDL